MATIFQINTYSQTALAACATNLAVGNENNTAKYKNSEVGMADAQATQFNSDWTVLEQSASDPVTGFSAVLLQRNDANGNPNPTGEKVLTIAGTNGPADVLSDLGIFLGNTVTDIQQYNALEAFYTKLKADGKLGSAEQFTITGHSLGGFLAQAFTARHTAVVSAAYTFNAPGLGAADTLLGYLGITNTAAANAKIKNVHATDGLSMTAGLGFMLGSTMPVRIENNGITDNHSIVRLSDTLAIYETYARLMPGISITQASALLAASGSVNRRQEDALDALRTVFIGSVSNDTNKTPTDNHDAFGANLYQLQDNANFKAVQGQVLIRPASADLRASARNNFGALVALQELSPIYLTGKDAAAQTVLDVTLQSSQADDYTAWAADKSTSTPTTFTDNWITDRAAMLGLLVIRNQTDSGQEVLVGGKPVVYTDTTSGTTVERGLASSSVEKPQVIFGSSGADAALNGLSKDDHIYGGAGADTLNGLGGTDYLEGGSGADTYDFLGSFGKDTVLDSDGAGSISFDGQFITNAKAIGERDTWAVDMGAGTFAKLSVFDDPRSSTGKRLVITKDSDTANTNTITIDNFNLNAAQGATGYLGIHLDPTVSLVVKEGTGSNLFADFNFNPATLSGSSAITEGGGKTFTLYLNQSAKAGDTITLALSGLADKFQAMLGDTTVPANGAVITLAEGQTQVSFALVQDGAVSANGSMQLSASYTGATSSATSNAWGVNLLDAGSVANTYTGDQRAKIIGTGNETQLSVTADKPSYGTYAWGKTSWATDGALINGLAAPGFSDVIYSTAAGTNGSVIHGYGGNDALSGSSGKDDIFSDEGDDLIGGGAGSDNIHGGDGNDYINASATLNMSPRLKPTDSWSPPAGQEVLTQGALWGIYKDSLPDGTPITMWSGSNSPQGTDSDVIDGQTSNATMPGTLHLIATHAFKSRDKGTFHHVRCQKMGFPTGRVFCACRPRFIACKKTATCASALHTSTTLPANARRSQA